MRLLTGCAALAAVCLCVPAAPRAAAGVPASSNAFRFAASERKAPDNEDLRHVRAIAQPKLSPDGKHVLVQITDATADGAKSHVWLVDVERNTARQLTYSRDADRRGESAAEWMPDGDSVLFLAHRGDHTQLFRLPMDGGEARPYDLKLAPSVDQSTAPDAIPPAKEAAGGKPAATPQPIEADVQRYFVAPDGKTIAITARDPETPGEKKQRDAKADAVVVDSDRHASRLYLLDAQSGKVTPAAVPPDVEGVAWSPDGSQLFAACRPMNNADDITPAATAWLVPIRDLDHPKQVK
ncbi:MAG TPA: hypothetical protein VGL62_14910, partial [Vicinamibacterales bacterium]